MQKIGLEAILEMANFSKGLKDYTSGIDQMDAKTEKGASVLGKFGGVLGGLAKTGLAVTAGAVTAVGGAMVAFIGDATRAAQATEGIRRNFDTLAQSIGSTADVMLGKLQDATRGMVKDSELMAASNKFLSMGLANTDEEAAKLAEMATQLGMAMGNDATQSMEDFALMLANQSIPRLDTFGISSGQVRNRIEELTKADKTLTREQAFMTAVMEQGTKTMERVGEQGDTTAANMARIQSTMANLKETVGAAFLPIFGELLGKFSEFVTAHAPRIEAAFRAIASWLMDELIPAIGEVIGWVRDNLIPAFQTLASWFTGTGSTSMTTFVNKILTFLAPAIEFAQEIFGKLVAWVQDNWPLIQQTIDTVMQAISTVIGAVLAVIQAFWEEHGAAIMTSVSNIWEIIKTIIGTTIDTILGIIRAVMQIINGDWAGAWETIKGVALGAWEAIKSIITLAIDNIKASFDIAKKVLGDIWDKLWAGIKNTAEQTWDKLVGAVSGWVGDFVGKFIQLADKILSIGTSIVEGIKEGIENAWDSFVNWVLGLMGGVIDAILNFIGAGSPAKAFMPIGESMAQGVAAGWAKALGGATFGMPAMSMSGAGGSTTNNSYGGDSFTFNVSSPQAWGMAQRWVETQRRNRLNMGM